MIGEAIGARVRRRRKNLDAWRNPDAVPGNERGRGREDGYADADVTVIAQRDVTRQRGKRIDPTVLADNQRATGYVGEAVDEDGCGKAECLPGDVRLF